MSRPPILPPGRVRLRRPYRYSDEGFGDSMEDHRDFAREQPVAGHTPGAEQQRMGWLVTHKALPAQISRGTIEWISINHVIGRGLSLTTLKPLQTGGPAGLVMGYAITSTVVYFLLQSIGEVMTFSPLIPGGILGLPSHFFDSALGFGMALSAYGSRAFTFPAQMSAAALLLLSFAPAEWDMNQMDSLQEGITAALVASAIIINFLPFSWYARLEKYSAVFKIWSYIALTLLCLTITCLPVSTSLVTPLLTAVPDPYACGSLFGLPGSTVTQVLLALRATNGTAFTPSVSLTHPSFPPTTSLSDIQAIIIEFLHPSSTIRLGTKYWSCPGPFVSYRIPGIGGQFLGTWQVLLQSVFSFVGAEIPGIAPSELLNPGGTILPAMKTVWLEITLLYVSAAFGLGLVCPSSYIPPSDPRPGMKGNNYANKSPYIAAIRAAGIPYLREITIVLFVHSAWSAGVSAIYSASRLIYLVSECGFAPWFIQWSYLRIKPKPQQDIVFGKEDEADPLQPSHALGKRDHDLTESFVFVPWAAMFISLLASVCSFWVTGTENEAFQWITLMTTCATILFWISLLVTYVTWFWGTNKAEESVENFRAWTELTLYRHRGRFQPYGALYALSMAMLILIFNSWSIFTVHGGWVIAETPMTPLVLSDPVLGSLLKGFVTAYLPLPLFLLAIFGYKLIVQSHRVAIVERLKRCHLWQEPDGDPREDGHWTDWVPIDGLRRAKNKLMYFWVRLRG